MTVSYVGGASAEATSLTLPTHQTGDLIFLFAWNPSSTTVPTVPSGWNSLRSVSRSTGTARAGVLAWKIATSSSETSGTWTNATLVGSVVYRDDSVYLVPGGLNGANDNTTTSFSYPAIDSISANNTNAKMYNANTWVAGFGGIVSNSLSLETAPSGMTNRVNIAGASTGELSIHDTNGDVSSFAAATVTLASSSAGSAFTVQLMKTGLSKSSGGGSLINSQQLVRQGWIG